MTTVKDNPAKWSVSDLVAISALRPLVTGYVPWTAWSMRPAAVASIINELEFKQRRSVVEIGSGTSTLFVARTLQGLGGRLVSIEHDPEFAAYIRRLLAREGLSDVATVETVDLVPLPAELAIDSPTWCAPDLWYDVDRVLASCPSQIDALIVDGPPAGAQIGVLTREPVIRVLRERFAERYSIFLDDTNRAPERETLGRWGAELSIETALIERISLGVGSSDGGISPTL